MTTEYHKLVSRCAQLQDNDTYDTSSKDTLDNDTSDPDGTSIVASDEDMTVGLLAFVGLALFAASVSINMELSLIVTFSESVVGRHHWNPSLLKVTWLLTENHQHHRTWETGRAVVFAVLLRSRCFGVLWLSESVLKALFLHCWNFFYCHVIFDEDFLNLTNCENDHRINLNILEIRIDRAWYQMCNILRLRIYWTTISYYILLLERNLGKTE